MSRRWMWWRGCTATRRQVGWHVVGILLSLAGLQELAGEPGGCSFQYCLLAIFQGCCPLHLPWPLLWAGAGKDWSLDSDFEGAGQQVQRGYLSMLAVDSLLAYMGSAEKLVDIAVEQGGVVPPALSKGPGSGGGLGEQVELRRGNHHLGASMVLGLTSCPRSLTCTSCFRCWYAVACIEVDVCKAMVERTWRGMLAVISQLLLRSSGEELVLQLLKVRGGGLRGQAAAGWSVLWG